MDEIQKRLARAEELMSAGSSREAAIIYAELCEMEHLTDEARANSLFGLGTCHYLAGDPQNAANELQRAWEILYASVGMKHPFTARVMVLLSRALFDMGSLSTGMEIGRSALENLEAIYGRNHEQTATAAFFLAGGAQAFNRLAEAEDLVNQAREAWTELHGHDSLQVAMCLDALGTLHDLCGELRQGTDFHSEALAIKFKILGERPDTAAACGAVGLAEAKLKNWARAHELLSRAVDILGHCEGDKAAQDRKIFSEQRDICQQHLTEGADNA